ncbi:Odorant receptor 227 [Nylanderia fulva]|uniref:Odorant receptor n=1 Tax=Nylanderia fulva TaxID=613905 RepID=A0A6G1LPX2_9HYME|nr:Odorant receptor 227 [Nylanderia fulva]
MDRSSKTILKDENDFNYAIQITRIILRILGLWPIPSFASIAERIAIRLQNIVCYTLLAFFLVPGLLLIFLKEDDFKRKVKLLGPLFNTCMAVVKYSLLIYYAQEIESCLEQARQDWQSTINWNNRKIMLSKAKTGRNFAFFSAAFIYVGGLSHRVIVPLSKGRILTPMNTTIRALAVPCYFVKFDEQESPAYEIVFLLQFLAGFITYSLVCGPAGLAAFFIMHVCGQLNILIDKLQGLNDLTEPEDRVVATLLADIVEHQIRVKIFLTQVEEAMRFIWLVELVGSTVLLCFAGYYIIMEWESSGTTAILSASLMLTSFIISIFTNCYVGQLLTDQSNKVGLTTSTMNWYLLPHKKARSLILIMSVSNIPAKISAGSMIEMSLPTFSNIIKTSMAYFNLLRKFIT